ncbi:hypothetical protein C0J52_11969 [Blattella germanica]|nr:hypothetical protein C0J52_11969 [Blattella germanica]
MVTVIRALQCVTPEIANLMRVIIMLCFLAMISSLLGFFLDIVGPTRKILKIIQRNSIPSIFTACNLLQHHSPSEDVQRRRLMDDWDGIETFSVMGGSLRGLDTPLESIPPPPPYSP